MTKVAIGKITHYFDHIGVAVLRVTEGSVNEGDRIFIGEDEGFEQEVKSMQVDHKAVAKADEGEEVGLKVDQEVKTGDIVYKVI